MNKSLLLADDDHDDAELFAEALSGMDPPIAFHHVEDGKAVFEFLEMSKTKLPDLIFLDLNMPEISGWQCLAKLKNDQRYQHITVIMYSTSSHIRDKEIAIELGATGFITKPSSFKYLQETLKEIVRSRVEDLTKILSQRVSR